MACTTILVGKKATYDGSTMIARNDDSGSGHFTPKRLTIVQPDMQMRSYTSVLSHVKIKLPENPLRYSAMPNAVEGKGIWAACGVNEANVGMTATETITSNERVLGADPLVVLQSERKKVLSYDPWNESPAPKTEGSETAGGIGEEDMVVLTLPYIRSAREGVLRLGSLLEQYGTYEMNGIAFCDSDEIWWLETIGGHHWIAKRVPDESYVVMPNQFGIDEFDLNDAFGKQRNHLCSKDLREFLTDNHLNLTLPDRPDSCGLEDAGLLPEAAVTGTGIFSPRTAFGSHDDADHVYNTPRAWYMLRHFNPHTFIWDGPDADFTPESDDLPWSLIPEQKITPQDIKYILSSHYQGTKYDPYLTYGDSSARGAYRSIGINRNDFLGFIQIRPYLPEKYRAVEWFAFASNAFSAMIPFYPEVNCVPAYYSCTSAEVTTESFYWTSRLIAALADSGYKKCLNHIEHYQLTAGSKSHEILSRTEKKLSASGNLSDTEIRTILEQANQETADMVREEASSALEHVLFEVSNLMKNQYARSDA